ncbi:hypothetical protein KUCAC02_000616, partial [Chaenocephalus aceratus]
PSPPPGDQQLHPGAEGPPLCLWDLHRGTVMNRLRNEAGVCCVAITDNADSCLWGCRKQRTEVWDPFQGNARSICGYGKLPIETAEPGTCRPAASCIRLIPGHQTSILLGLSHSPALLSIRVTSRTVRSAVSHDEDLFGESSSSEEEEGDA